MTIPPLYIVQAIAVITALSTSSSQRGLLREAADPARYSNNPSEYGFVMNF